MTESASDELVAAEKAYRKILFTIIGHVVFFVLCCAVAVIARRMLKMPPALLTVVFAVAALLFGGDFLRFRAARRRLADLRAGQSR